MLVGDRLRAAELRRPCRIGAHLAQVHDEAVSLIEAVPRQGHLGGTDGPSPFDVQQALYVHVIGHHVLEA